MSIKFDFKNGNNPFDFKGEINRGTYFIYALILDILFRLFLALGTVLGKEISPVLFILGFIALPIILLKGFNYKKRFQSFLGNSKLSFFLSILYLLIGAYVQEYTYLLKLLNKKLLYELTANSPAYHDLFEQYASINMPSFIGSNSANIIFYVLCAIGFIMFLCLIFVPAKNKSNENINNQFEYNNFFKNNKSKILIIVFTLILFIISATYAYSKFKVFAYKGITYQMNQEEIDDLNKTLKIRYESKLYEYNLDLNNYKNRVGNSYALKKLIPLPIKPPVPQFYGVKYSEIDEKNGITIDDFDPLVESGIILGYPRYNPYMEHFNVPTGLWVTLVNSELDYFDCNYRTYGIFNSSCGKLKFNENNLKYINGDNYKKFNPKMIFMGICAVLMLLSLIISLCIVNLYKFIKQKFQNINFKEYIKIKLPKISIPQRNSLTNKLEELNKLKEKGLITEDDYNNKKNELLEKYK